MAQCWFFLKFRARALGWVEDTQPEEIELRPSIHLAFEILQADDLTLQLTVAEGQVEGGFNGSVILLQVRRKPAQGRDLASQSIF